MQLFQPVSATHSFPAWNRVPVLKVDSSTPWCITLGGLMFIFPVFICSTTLEYNQLNLTSVPRVPPVLLGQWQLYSACSDTRQRCWFLYLCSAGRDSNPTLPRVKGRDRLEMDLRLAKAPMEWKRGSVEWGMLRLHNWGRAGAKRCQGWGVTPAGCCRQNPHCGSSWVPGRDQQHPSTKTPPKWVHFAQQAELW